MGLCIWQINCSVFHCYEVWKLYCETTITHSSGFKHSGLSKASQSGKGGRQGLEREESTRFRLTLLLNGFFYFISLLFKLSNMVDPEGKCTGGEGKRGGKEKKQKQPKLSDLFIRGFVFEHLNESCVCFSLFSICDCSLLCSVVSGHFVMTVLILFYILFYYRVIVASPLPHLAVMPPAKSNFKLRGYVKRFP